MRRQSASPADVVDVAERVLRAMGPMTGLKLQKLVYYSQVWHLVWEEAPLFAEPVQGWINGPVVRKLWEKHQGMSRVESVGGHPDRLTPEQVDVIDKVLALYGRRPAEFLSSLTHDEAPWKESREGLAPNERGSREITHESIVTFYEQARPGGEGIDLHLDAHDVESMVIGEEQLARGEFVTLEDLASGLQSQAV